MSDSDEDYEVLDHMAQVYRNLAVQTEKIKALCQRKAALKAYLEEFEDDFRTKLTATINEAEELLGPNFEPTQQLQANGPAAQHEDLLLKRKGSVLFMAYSEETQSLLSISTNGSLKCFEAAADIQSTSGKLKCLEKSKEIILDDFKDNVILGAASWAVPRSWNIVRNQVWVILRSKSACSFYALSTLEVIQHPEMVAYNRHLMKTVENDNATGFICEACIEAPNGKISHVSCLNGNIVFFSPSSKTQKVIICDKGYNLQYKEVFTHTSVSVDGKQLAFWTTVDNNEESFVVMKWKIGTEKHPGRSVNFSVKMKQPRGEMIPLTPYDEEDERQFLLSISVDGKSFEDVNSPKEFSRCPVELMKLLKCLEAGNKLLWMTYKYPYICIILEDSVTHQFSMKMVNEIPGTSEYVTTNIPLNGLGRVNISTSPPAIIHHNTDGNVSGKNFFLLYITNEDDDVFYTQHLF